MREQVPGPPPGYRPHMSLRVKLEAALLALGLDPTDTDFDHRPPLQMRRWNPETQDTEPPANDPRFIVPMGRPAHREVTKTDQGEIARTRKLTKKEAAFRARLLARDTGAPPPREKPKRKIRSRGFQKRTR